MHELEILTFKSKRELLETGFTVRPSKETVNIKAKEKNWACVSFFNVFHLQAQKTVTF